MPLTSRRRALPQITGLTEARPQFFSLMGKLLAAIVLALALGACVGLGATLAHRPTPYSRTSLPGKSPVARTPLPQVVVTSPFGRRGFSFHSGIDLRASEGAPLASVADGVVERVHEGGRGGRSVVIRLDSGWRAGYAHLSRIDVKEGERVVAGAQIGRAGSTGHATGPHLHLELRDPRSGRLTDPGPYLRRR